MKFQSTVSQLQKCVSAACSVVERKQTLPILGNLLLEVVGGKLQIIGSDSETEVRSTMPVDGEMTAITVPAQKLNDILRNLAKDAAVELALNDAKMVVKCQRSKFTLTTLPAADYPSSEQIKFDSSFTIDQATLKSMLEKVKQSMASQDVRYYLNGMLFDMKDGTLRVVATDGHRLSLAECDAGDADDFDRIIPRKAVLELLRMLGDEGTVSVSIARNNASFVVGDTAMTTKLIDGSFPDYAGVIPSMRDQKITVNVGELKSALARNAILTSEKYKGVKMILEGNILGLMSYTPENEEAEETVDVSVMGAEDLEIGFNIAYLIDALSNVESERADMFFTSGSSSVLITPQDDESVKHVVMPMRL